MDDSSTLTHVLERLLGRYETPRDIHCKDALKVLESDVLRSTKHTDARIVDQDIDLAEECGDMLYSGAYSFWITRIGSQRDRSTASRGDFINQSRSSI
ncbi:hypothetical protein D9M71_701640 [compost metagenome]